MVLEKEIGKYYYEVLYAKHYIVYYTPREIEQWICIDDEEYDTSGYSSESDVTFRRLATHDEIEHLQQCIQEKDYVPYKPLNTEEIWF